MYKVNESKLDKNGSIPNQVKSNRALANVNNDITTNETVKNNHLKHTKLEYDDYYRFMRGYN